MEKVDVKQIDTKLDKKTKHLDKSGVSLSWESLIDEARRQIDGANAAIRAENRKIRGLKQSIKYFQQQLDEGEPFPGKD
jgi:hypothetical protein